MYAERHTVTITTDASGDGTGYTEIVNGRVITIKYTKTDYADGVDFAVTGENSGISIWSQSDVNATATVAPRQATHATDGTAALYAATYAVLDYIVIAEERIKIVVAQGGDTKSGTFEVVVG